jgi:hypothetical protein
MVAVDMVLDMVVEYGGCGCGGWYGCGGYV